MNKGWRQVALGFILPHLLGVAAVWLCGRLTPEAYTGQLVLSLFVIVPLSIGLLSAYCWRGTQASTAAYVNWSFANTLIAILVSAIWLREGSLCLLMACPLILAFVVVGTFVGRHLFEKKNRLNVYLAPILLLFLIADARTPHHHEATVTDTLIVRAPASAIWKHVLEVPPLPPSRHWLFRLGMPSPVYTRVDKPVVGGRRECVFEGDYFLDERITSLQPNRELAFDIVGQLAHPEIMGHLTLNSGQIVLHENGDGTTTLTGTTRYQLHVYPAAYFQLWSDDLCREVHRSVMGHLKTLAESEETGSPTAGP